MRLVEVEWVDSHVHDRWVSPEELSKTVLARCTTVGYLVQDEDGFITVAQSLGVKADGGVEEFGQALTIPRSALLSEPCALTKEEQLTGYFDGNDRG